MKNQWPLWMFVIGVVMIVLFAFNYEGQNEVVSLSEIFPDDEFSDMPQVTYEFIDKEGVATPIQARPTPLAVERTTAQTVEVKRPVVAKQPAPKPVQRVEAAPALNPVPRTAPVPVVKKQPAPAQVNTASQVSKIKFTIQIASSNNKERAMAALKKVKAKGYDAYLVEKNLGSKGVWYRTYIGKFSSKSEAQSHLSKVSRDYPGSFLISPK